MITCVVDYTIDPRKIEDLRARVNSAIALFSFPSLAEYEMYRMKTG